MLARMTNHYGTVAGRILADMPKLHGNGRKAGSAPQRVSADPKQQKQLPKVDQELFADVADAYINALIATKLFGRDDGREAPYVEQYEKSKVALREAAYASKASFMEDLLTAPEGHHKSRMERMVYEGWNLHVDSKIHEEINRADRLETIPARLLSMLPQDESHSIPDMEDILESLAIQRQQHVFARDDINQHRYR